MDADREEEEQHVVTSVPDAEWLTGEQKLKMVKENLQLQTRRSAYHKNRAISGVFGSKGQSSQASLVIKGVGGASQAQNFIDQEAIQNLVRSKEQRAAAAASGSALDEAMSPSSNGTAALDKLQSKSTAAFTMNTAIASRPVTAKTHLMGAKSRISVSSSRQHHNSKHHQQKIARMHPQVEAAEEQQNLINLNLNGKSGDVIQGFVMSPTTNLNAHSSNTSLVTGLTGQKQ